MTGMHNRPNVANIVCLSITIITNIQQSKTKVYTIRVTCNTLHSTYMMSR